MESDTNSDESTAASGHNNAFRCPHSFKVFGSRQALGGHQNAHRINRVVRRITDLMEVKRNHPIVQPPYSENVQPRIKGHGLNQQGPGSTAEIGDGVPQLQLVAGNGSHREYHFELRPAPEELPQSLTRDYLGEWMLISAVERDSEESKRSSETTISDPVIRISMGGEDGDEINSKKKEDLDLELKLGF